VRLPANTRRREKSLSSAATTGAFSQGKRVVGGTATLLRLMVASLHFFKPYFPSLKGLIKNKRFKKETAFILVRKRHQQIKVHNLENINYLFLLLKTEAKFMIIFLLRN